MSRLAMPPDRRLVVAITIALTASLVVAEPARSAEPIPPAPPVATPASEHVSERPDRVSAQLAARLQGSRVEVAADRSETTLVFANPDGTFTEEAYAGPVRIRTGSGDWVSVDTTLVAGRDRIVRPRATPAALEFSLGGAGPFAKVSYASRSLRVGWPAPLPAPVLAGDTATYPNVVPGGDLVVTALPTGFSHSLVLRQQPPGPLVLRLPVELTGGLSLQRHAGTHQLRLRDAQGATIAAAPPPRMWGADIDPRSGAPAQTREVATSVESGPNGPVLVLRPDARFLASVSGRLCNCP